MSAHKPRPSYDMTGWTEVTCYAADVIRRQGSTLSVASSLTDPNGLYGPPRIFTEWWWKDTQYPVLRDYRDPGEAIRQGECSHYVATGPEAVESEDDE